MKKLFLLFFLFVGMSIFAADDIDFDRLFDNEETESNNTFSVDQSEYLDAIKENKNAFNEINDIQRETMGKVIKFITPASNNGNENRDVTGILYCDDDINAMTLLNKMVEK